MKLYTICWGAVECSPRTINTLAKPRARIVAEILPRDLFRQKFSHDF